jgi:hypothetical protein
VWDEIGLMKDESNGQIVEEGYFISPKVYGLKLSDGKAIIKSKGLPVGSLTFDHLLKLYNGETLIFPYIPRSFNNFSNLFIHFNKVNLSISRDDSNTKFINIYDSTGKWISTKPIKIKTSFFLKFKNIFF